MFTDGLKLVAQFVGFCAVFAQPSRCSIFVKGLSLVGISRFELSLAVPI